MIRQILPLVSAAALLAGCGSQAPVATGDNFAYLYGKGATDVRLDARVYQPADGQAVIYFKLRTADLLYKGSGGGGPYYARVQMRYEAFPEPGSRQLLDSASTSIRDQALTPTEDKELIGSMPLKLTRDEPFILRITAHDLNRDVQSTVLLRMDRAKASGARDFLPLRPDNLPLFDDHVAPGTRINVQAERHAQTVLTVDHYPAVEQLPAPVFTQAQPPALGGPPDSSFTVMVGADGTFPFTAGNSGFYHFRADTASANGFTLYVHGPGYPTIQTAEDMVVPLRYITSNKEWEEIAAAPDPRKQVERFWTDAAGSRDRAREAIAAYYGRVESANRHFTSYTEGWRTDRGLVHIIFGTPTTIRKSAEGESWTYGDESNLMSLVFTFVRREEPFSNNDLMLRRDPQLKSAWYRNVESWRNGRILPY